MTTVAGGTIEAADPNNLRQRIINEAARRSMSVPALPAEAGGYETVDCSASWFNQIVEAMNYLQNGAGPNNHDIYTAYQGNEIVAFDGILNQMAALEADPLIYKLPDTFNYSDGSEYQIGGYMTGSLPGRNVNLTNLQFRMAYCGGGWHNMLGEGYGISFGLVDVGSGRRAEQLSVSGNFRRGCGCGNDMQVYRQYWVRAVNDAGGVSIWGAQSINQWGC